MSASSTLESEHDMNAPSNVADETGVQDTSNKDVKHLETRTRGNLKRKAVAQNGTEKKKVKNNVERGRVVRTNTDDVEKTRYNHPSNEISPLAEENSWFPSPPANESSVLNISDVPEFCDTNIFTNSITTNDIKDNCDVIVDNVLGIVKDVSNDLASPGEKERTEDMKNASPPWPDFDDKSDEDINFSQMYCNELQWNKDITTSASNESVASDNGVIEEEADNQTSVMRKANFDPDLVDSYINLPFLNYAFIKPTKTSEDLLAFYDMRLWKDTFPGKPAIIESIKKALMFSSKNFYYNLARVDPTLLSARTINEKRYIVQNSSSLPVVVLVTTGCCASCKLVTPKIRNSNDGKLSSMKAVELIPHTQEFQRTVAAIGHIFEFKSCTAPCYSGHTLTFSTRSASYEKSGEGTSKFKEYLSQKLSTRRNNLGAASEKPAIDERRFRNGSIPTSLAPSDQIPIFDARNSSFTLQNDIENLSALPLYKKGSKDLPDGSCISVGHTVGLYADRLQPQRELLSLNLLWVVVWGTPATFDL